MNENDDRNLKSEYFSIPNLMGYFRILLIPVYLYVYLSAEDVKDYYLAAGIMGVSFLTDFFDGKIARRFDMVTDFGKMLDPIADKLTQGAMAVSFMARHPVLLWLLLVFLAKEAFMGIAGAYMLRKGHPMGGARWHGKVCTAVLDLTFFILLLLPKVSYGMVQVMTVVCICVMAFSLGMYAKMYWGMWKTVKEE